MKKRVFAMIMAAMLTVSVFTGCENSDYTKAVELQEAGNYEAAAELFESLDDHKDSAERLAACLEILDAREEYETLKAELDNKNAELDAVISVADDLVLNGGPALDMELITALETAVSEAKAERKELAALSEEASAAELKEALAAIGDVDYSAAMANIADRQAALEESMQLYALVNNPAEAYVIQCLLEVPHVMDVAAVTEDNDPNGKLNKSGGYTAAVFFTCDYVDQTMIFGDSVIEKGTIGGGCIEVYATVSDAEKRNEYLASFDGSFLSAGSHAVIGTVVVRTSDEMTASQQKEIEANIIAALTTLED